jgi:hypothetical protein
MSRRLFLLLFLLGTVRAAAAEPRASTAAVRQEIVAVIAAQLAAFREGDPGGAYALASADLRAQRPPAAFAEIVRRNYPEIWTNTRAEYGIVRDDGARAAVAVQVYSKTGDAAYDYELVRERSGWRIRGVLRRTARREKA